MSSHDRQWDAWMASPTQWTWVWVNSGSWWWRGRPGMPQSMGSQRVRHDWVTELNWTELPRVSFVAQIVKNQPAMQETWVWSLGWEDPRKIPWRREQYPLLYSCLQNFMDIGAWWATVHGVAKSWTGLSDFHFT